MFWFEEGRWLIIWIRSKKGQYLINANEIWIVGNEIRATVTTNENTCTIIGSYKNPDKVLDQIHTFLNVEADRKVFLMPADNE